MTDDKVFKVGAEVGMEFLQKVTVENLKVSEAMLALVNMTSAILASFHHSIESDADFPAWIDAFCEGLKCTTNSVTAMEAGKEAS